MRHPRFIVFLRELQGNPQAWDDKEARKTAEMDPELGGKQFARNRADRERSMPSYVTVYAGVVLVAGLMVGGLWWLVAG